MREALSFDSESHCMGGEGDGVTTTTLALPTDARLAVWSGHNAEPGWGVLGLAMVLTMRLLGYIPV